MKLAVPHTVATTCPLSDHEEAVARNELSKNGKYPRDKSGLSQRFRIYIFFYSP